MHACYQQLGYSVYREICRLQCTSRIYLAGCISEYINEGPLVFSKFHVTYYLTPSFLVLYLKREICLLLWIKSYLQKLKKMKNKNEPVWLIKSPKCKFNLYHALFFFCRTCNQSYKMCNAYCNFLCYQVKKNSRSMISIPMNKNLFPGDFFSRCLSMHFYIVVCNGISSVPVFLTRSWHCCPLSHNLWCHGSLQREIHIHPVHYGHWGGGGGKLLMDFKITIKWSI